jgi:hypothetical protein
VGYVLWRSIWLVVFLLFWGCLWVLGKRLAMRLLRCWEYFWKRLLKIGDGLLNVWWLMVDQFRGERLKSEDRLNATCVVFNLKRL